MVNKIQIPNTDADGRNVEVDKKEYVKYLKSLKPTEIRSKFRNRVPTNVEHAELVSSEFFRRFHQEEGRFVVNKEEPQKPVEKPVEKEVVNDESNEAIQEVETDETGEEAVEENS